MGNGSGGFAVWCVLPDDTVDTVGVISTDDIELKAYQFLSGVNARLSQYYGDFGDESYGTYGELPPLEYNF